MNYYNDNDQKTCAWLRELIEAGELPPGDVDERSITEIKADELNGYDQCHFFAGIGGWATPRAEDAESAGMRHSRGVADTLTAQAGQGMPLAGWSTPDTVPDAPCKGTNATHTIQGLGNQAHGMIASYSPAATERPAGYRLNPRFSLWLMGYPDAWASCGERAMQSFRSARRSS